MPRPGRRCRGSCPPRCRPGWAARAGRSWRTWPPAGPSLLPPSAVRSRTGHTSQAASKQQLLQPRLPSRRARSWRPWPNRSRPPWMSAGSRRVVRGPRSSCSAAWGSAPRRPSGAELTPLCFCRARGSAGWRVARWTPRVARRRWSSAVPGPACRVARATTCSASRAWTAPRSARGCGCAARGNCSQARLRRPCRSLPHGPPQSSPPSWRQMDCAIVLASTSRLRQATAACRLPLRRWRLTSGSRGSRPPRVAQSAS
mmetsp:Transcript_30292/g.95601  ORF Transcript_30292/g.95601 Transcript_30292/m.95601 type:complete len:257 (-) Transcript_30292:101-871(-)